MGCPTQCKSLDKSNGAQQRVAMVPRVTTVAATALLAVVAITVASHGRRPHGYIRPRPALMLLGTPSKHGYPRLLSRLVLQLTAARGHGWAMGGQLEEQWLGNGWARGGRWGGQWSNGSRRGVLWLQVLPHGPRRSPLDSSGVWSHLMKATGGQMCGIDWRGATRICGLSNNHASKQKV